MLMMRSLLSIACLLPLAVIPVGAAQTTTPSKCGDRCLTLHGTKNADHGLGFSVAYATTAKTKDCVTYNPMAGVTTQQTRYEFMPPVRKGETYRIEIPLGKHVGGACGWKAVGIFLDVVSVASRREPPKPGVSLLGFSDAPATIQGFELKCRRCAYTRASGAEQAAYLCLTQGPAPNTTLGPGSHDIELNFGKRP